MSSSVALELDAQSMFGRKGPGCGESTFGELGSSADVEAFTTPSYELAVRLGDYSVLTSSSISDRSYIPDSRLQISGKGIRNPVTP